MINKDRMVKNFMEMVQIDSVSLHERAMVDYLVAYFTAKGYDTVEDRTPIEEIPGATGGNVIVKIPGNSEKETLIICAHTDTVEPGNGITPQISSDGKYITSDGTTILGADDKAGIAQIIEIVNIIEENTIDHPPLELFFPMGEELGLVGAQHFDSSKVEGKRVVILDGGSVPGDVIVAAPSYYKVFGTIVGKASHAGGAPDKGISSIQVMSKAIAKMHMLKVDEETTTNVGKVICDFPLNVVPEITTFGIEVRSINIQKGEDQVKHVVDAIQSEVDAHGATATITVEQALVAYEMSEDHPMIQAFKKMCELQGYTYNPIHSRGGSDMTALRTYHGIEGIVIAPGGEFAHTLQERVNIENFVACTEQLLAIVTTF